MRTYLRKTEWNAVWLAGLVLAGAVLSVPCSAQAEWFWESWFRPAGMQPVVHSGNGLVVYNNTARSWAHLPSIVYASVPTVDNHYPVYPQHVMSGMPVQTASVPPVVVQSRPYGVYGGGGE